MDQEKKDSIDALKDELKKFEAEMQKLERSLTPESKTLLTDEKSAVKEELENRLKILRKEERGKELRKQLERDAKLITKVKDTKDSKDSKSVH
jgi:hypothetical protein